METLDMDSKPKRAVHHSAAINRVRRGEAFWREAIARQRAGALSQAAFCAREGLAVSTFALWSARLRDAELALSSPDPQFIDCTGWLSGAQREAQDATALHVRLELGGGLTLEIRRG
jgi:hypothetical protein